MHLQWVSTVETKRAGSPSIILLNDKQTNIAPGSNGWNILQCLC